MFRSNDLSESCYDLLLRQHKREGYNTGQAIVTDDWPYNTAMIWQQLRQYTGTIVLEALAKIM